uniref:Uncharacterized protein n=1 Tax=Saccharum hybrid cultivar SP80-3280 TaxID=193079 RepID=A0A4P2TFX8_9POAL|nr:centromere protein c/hypothetical protein fusion [Saccharum hybrid cultivar SP80-3280]AWY10727.1 centromere protein c/hypothetical protein fusion [Saccharum hybrid cultivar SP80-3280]
MDESRKRAVSTANAKNISSSLDEDFGYDFLSSWDFGNDFLSSWKLPKSGKDTIDFTVPKSSKKFSFDNLDDFELDGAFDKLPSFQMGMSDLDFSSPQKKKVKHSSSNADHSEEKKETDKDNFSFSFDFSELGKFSLDGKLGIEEKSTSRFTGKSDPVSSEVKKDTQRGLSAKGNAILEENNSTNKAHTLDTCTLRPSHLTNHESVKNVSQPTSNIDAADSSDKMQERTSVNPATMEQTKVDSVLNDNPGEQPKEIYPTKAPVDLPSQDFSCSAISSEDPTQGLADPVNSKDAPIVDSGKVHVSRESNDDEQLNGLRSRDTSIINPNVSRRPVGQFNSRNEVLEESVSLNEGSQDNQSFSGAPKKFLKKTSHGTKNTEEEISGPKSLSCSMQREIRSVEPALTKERGSFSLLSKSVHMYLVVVKEGGVLQDKSSQSLEMPLEDINPVNQPQMHGGSTKKLAPDLCNALSLTKQKKQQAAQEGKMKKQSKRGKKVADESSHALEIPQANLDLENQPHNDDVNIEQQTVLSSTLSPNHAKGQKGAQRTNKTKKLNQRKILGDAGLEQPSGVRRSTRTRSRPLEHWLGERLLYGPINDTLPAVIGIKAYSPGQDGKRTLKVKSVVPDQYSDLVAKSATY